MSPAPVVLALLDLLAPPRCAACDLRLEPEESGFCGGCVVLLEPAPPGLRPPAPLGAAHAHEGPLADAVRRYKFGGRWELARPLGALLAAVAQPYAGHVDVVAPVPLHGRRLRARGYDQASLLARPVARALGVPCVPALLHRTRPTRPQVGLDAAARARNVAGAFCARRAPGRVLLIDDVATTFSTLREAAAALRRAGAREVACLALAHAPAPARRG